MFFQKKCLIKEEIIKVELPRWDGWSDRDWSDGNYFFKEGDEIICETGVVIYEYSHILANFDMNKDYTCLIKTKTEEFFR